MANAGLAPEEESGMQGGDIYLLLERKLGHTLEAEQLGMVGKETVIIGLCDRKSLRIS